MQKKDSRYRKQHRFWLDLEVEGDYLLDNQLHHLKSMREFARAIRESFRLLLSLRSGNVDVLLDLFPDVTKWLEVKMTPPTPPIDTSGLETKLDRVEQLLLYNSIEQGGNGMLMEQANRMPRRELPPKPVNDLPMLTAKDEDSSANLLDAFL